MGLEFTHHAKNGMRRVGLSEVEVESLVRGNMPYDHDQSGRPRYVVIAKGVQVRIVLAVDKPNLVVTLHERRKR